MSCAEPEAEGVHLILQAYVPRTSDQGEAGDPASWSRLSVAQRT